MAFREYLCTQKKKTTALGYMSSLSKDSFVSEIAEAKYHVNDLFEIQDLDTLRALYKDVVKDERNILGHSRYSAALNFYMTYLTSKKMSENEI